MSSFVLSGLIFACLFSGFVVGGLLRRLLPDHHLSPDSRDTIKVGTGLIATMAALVLGIMVGSAKGSYDTQKNQLTQLSAKIIVLDRTLAHYGPESREIRDLIRESVQKLIARIWPDQGSDSTQLDPMASNNEIILDKIQALVPRTDAQRGLQSQAVSMATDIAQARWLLFQQSESAISTLFLVVLVFWLALIYAGIGLFAPYNATVLCTVLLCALSVAGAILLILELDNPFQGIIRISSTPMLQTLSHLGH